MANLTIKEPPEFTAEVHQTEKQEFITADLENEIKSALLNNDVFLKALAEAIQKKSDAHIENGSIHVTSQDKQNWSGKAGTAVATQAADGLESAADKRKLDGIKEGAEVNQNAFSNVKVGNVVISANGKTATFTLVAGSNITISADNATKQITIKAERDGGNADKLDGYDAAHFAASDHGHDDRYYTESEVNTLLNGKSNTNHTHGYANASHTHDDRYYTESEVNTLLNGKSNTSHTHNYISTSASCNKNWNWSGQEGQPSWLWGGNEISNMYVYNPKNFHVNYADSAGGVAWGNVSGKPSSYPPSSHNHDGSYLPCLPGLVSGYVTTVQSSNTEIGDRATAEGENTTASGSNSHAEGMWTKASGAYSHAEGQSSIASNSTSHAEGYGTKASNYASHVGGKYNVAMVEGGNRVNKVGHVFVLGNGTSNSARSNAFSVMYDGTVKAASTITASTAADYAEFFEWLDGNADKEDRVGHFVTLDGTKIRYATSQDAYILGIISGEAFVLGNGDCDTWNGMYVRDAFNRVIQEPAPKMVREEVTEEIEREIQEVDEKTGKFITRKEKEVVVIDFTEKEVFDEEGNPVYEGTRPKLNPSYKPNQTYISRFDRPEWDAVGMLGVLSVYDDGTCEVNGYCKCNDFGIATKAESGYRVIERVTENIIKVVFR